MKNTVRFPEILYFTNENICEKQIFEFCQIFMKIAKFDKEYFILTPPPLQLSIIVHMIVHRTGQHIILEISPNSHLLYLLYTLHPHLHNATTC